jgi:hypothetical protein
VSLADTPVSPNEPNSSLFFQRFLQIETHSDHVWRRFFHVWRHVNPVPRRKPPGLRQAPEGPSGPNGLASTGIPGLFRPIPAIIARKPANTNPFAGGKTRKMLHSVKSQTYYIRRRGEVKLEIESGKKMVVFSM